MRLSDDTKLLVDVLWVLCRDQAGDITDVEFADRLFGEPIEQASESLIDAIILSFPVGKRSLLRSLWTQQAAMLQRGLEMAEAKLRDAKITTATDAKMSKELDAVFSQALGIAPSPTTATNGPEF